MKTSKKPTTALLVLAFIAASIFAMLFIGYVVSPIDFIPVFVGGIVGIIDDIIALVAALGTTAGAVTSLVFAIKGQKKQDIVVAC